MDSLPPSAEALHESLSSLPAVTAEIPPIPGELKSNEEDFVVEEVPAYLPSGQGEHLYLWVEKRGLSTPEAAKRLAAQLGCPAQGVGWAGLKDRKAITRQWLSFHHPHDPPAALALEGVRVLQASRHGNKLKPGHLRANRFQLRLGGVPAERDAHAQQVLSQLATHGMPNYFGSQRFGIQGRNLREAHAWIAGGGRAPRKPFLRTLWVSSLQSALFNLWLAARVTQKQLDRAIEGDILRKEDTGGLFVCENAAVDSERARRWEISATGPMFGARMRRAAAEEDRLEATLLARWALAFDSFDPVRRFGEGTRRVARVRPSDLSCRREGLDLLLEFTLPSGAYATVLIAELTKNHGLALDSLDASLGQ